MSALFYFTLLYLRWVTEVGDAGRLDGPDLLELYLCVPEVVEETSTVAEHHGNDVELEFVQQSRCQILVSDLGSAPKHDVFVAGDRLAWSSADSIPSVTKWNVVPPSISTGSRG